MIDEKTHKEIAVMRDEFGRAIPHPEKVLSLAFEDGKLIDARMPQGRK